VVKGVSAALEAVCLKALRRLPEDRYQSAGELAEEVKRWLAGEPVKAWPEPWVVRARRWVRKHRPLAASAAAALLVAAGATGWVAHQERQRDQARLAQAQERDREAEGLLGEIQGMRASARRVEPALAKLQLVQALARAERAATLLGEVGADEELKGRVERVRVQLKQQAHDQEMVVRLEEARLKGAELARGAFDSRQIAREYRGAFAWYLGVNDLATVSKGELTGRLDGSTVRPELAAALDDWSDRAEVQAESAWARGLAAKLDDDPSRRQIREALGRQDRKALARLARSGRLVGQPASTLVLLGRVLRSAGAVREAERVLRHARRTYPGDFWVNHDLGMCLRWLTPPQKAEAVRFLTAAVAVRSQSPGAYVNLGNALSEQGRHRDAEEAYRQAVKLRPDYAEAHSNLGNVLSDQGRHRDAEEAHRQAVKLRPGLARAYTNLGVALYHQGRHKEAEDAYHQTIKLQPDYAGAYTNLGNVLSAQGRPREAEDAHRQAIMLRPDYADAHTNLGLALSEQGRHKEAEEAHRQAIKLQPDDAAAHVNLGLALNSQGRHREAEQSCRRALELRPGLPQAHYNLALALNRQARHQEAEESCRAAIKLKPDYAKAHGGLGLALTARGQFETALAAFRRCASLQAPGGGYYQLTRQRIRETERILVLDGKLPGVIAGKLRPASPAEGVELAELAQRPCRSFYAAVASLYADAFQCSPELVAPHRYNAACAAALAGAGEGKDAGVLDASGRAQLRYAALGYLQDGLSAHARQLAGGIPGAAQRSRQSLAHWLKDPDLAAVRDQGRLAGLPEAERVAWRNLWAQVDALLAVK
jgi:tetratricopeptide (TPR) repeat protein